MRNYFLNNLTFQRKTQPSAAFAFLTAAFLLACPRAHATEAAPTISPNNQVYASGPQTVTITDTDGSAVIHYTTNGTTPTPSSPTYSSAFSVSTTTTVQAIAIGTGGTSSVTTSVVQIDATTANVPRTGLMTWQKSDLGLTISGSSVTAWSDASGNSMNLSTTSGQTSPTYHASAINGLPSVTFDGVANSMFYPSGFADLTSGCSIFIAYRPIGRASGQLFRTDYFGGYNIDIWPLWNGGQPMSLFIYNGTPSFNSTFFPNQYQAIALTHDGVSQGKYYINGQLFGQGTTAALTNIVRNQNYVGGYGYANYINAEVVEILFYNRLVTATEFSNIESYLAGRVLGPNPSAPVAPVFSLAAGTLTAPTQLGVSTAPGAITYVTTDGTTPTSSSPVLTGSLQLNYSQTVKAISIQNGLSSAVTSAAYTLDTTKYPAPSASDTSTMQINLQSPSVAQ